MCTSCQLCSTTCPHFLQFFHKEYTAYDMKTGKMAFVDIGVIPMDGERNLMLQIGNVIFVDLVQFLSTSLEKLVKEMCKSGGTNQFIHTT